MMHKSGKNTNINIGIKGKVLHERKAKSYSIIVIKQDMQRQWYAK